jgi:hypothetical protein
MPQCHRCQDVGWVCENHAWRPWGKEKPFGCECGVGVPCPDCNAIVGDCAPQTTGVIVSIDAVRRKRRLS